MTTAARRLAAVFAHPDDDTFGIAGTAAELAERGEFELGVILATSGEAGMISDPTLATPATLGVVREAESRASWAALGVVPSPHAFLRFSDGGLGDVDRDELVEAIGEQLRSFEPEVVVTFGPEGITAHQDHVRVGEAATEAFRRAREAGVAGFRRLLFASLGQVDFDRFSDLLREHGLDPPDPTQPFEPRPVPEDRIAVRVDCREVVDRKLAALREHATQRGELEAIPDEVWGPVLRWEAFVQAWPERPAGAPVLSDPFEELEPDPGGTVGPR